MAGRISVLFQLESRYREVSYYSFDVIFLWNPLISHDEVDLPFSQAPNSFMSPVMYPTALQTLFPALLSGFCFIGFLSPLVSILTSTLFSMVPLVKFKGKKKNTVHFNTSYWSVFIGSTTYCCSLCVIFEPERGKSLLWTPDSHISMSTFSLLVLLGPSAVLPDFRTTIDVNTKKNQWGSCHSGISPFFDILLSDITFSRNQAALDAKGDIR